MAPETIILVIVGGILALIVFFVVVTVLDALDVQPGCILVGGLWLVLVLALLWLVTR